MYYLKLTENNTYIPLKQDLTIDLKITIYYNLINNYY